MNHLYLRVIVPLAITLPLFFAFINIKRVNNTGRIIFLYLLISAIVNVVVAITAAFGTNNLPLLHIFTVIEFVIVTNFYKTILDDNKLGKWYTFMQVAFTMLCIINAVFFQSIYIYNSYTRSIEAIIIMLFLVNYFAKLFAQFSSQRITSLPSFWFNTGLFLYFSWSFMFFIFSNIVAKQSSRNGTFLWYIHGSFVLIMYFLFATGFFKASMSKEGKERLSKSGNHLEEFSIGM